MITSDTLASSEILAQTKGVLGSLTCICFMGAVLQQLRKYYKTDLFSCMHIFAYCSSETRMTKVVMAHAT